jgi:hypothetical protein
MQADLLVVMSTLAGRRFLWHLLDDRCQLHGGSFTGNSQTFFNEGRRSVAIELMQDIQRSVPEKYLDMVKEQLSEQRVRKQTDVAAKAVMEQEEGDDNA